MRLARGGRDKKSFIAQILADVVLQNQSMADRRVFAREVGDLLKLQNLNAGKAKILLDSPTNAGQLAESELIAIMIHNNAIQQNIFDLAHISEKSGTEFRDFTERMRFDIDEEEMMDRLHNIAPESEGLPETQKLQPQMAGQVNQIVRLVLDDLKKLKVDGDNFWEKLYETMDKMYNLIPQEKRA
jgi:hypothetical protein